MSFSSVRTALQSNGRAYFNTASKGRTTNRVAGSLRRSLSSTSSETTSSTQSTQPPTQEQGKQRLIPTRHSSKAPAPVCRDPVELQDLTQELLETPVGSLFCQNHTVVKTSASPTDDRDDAYAVARESGELVEYLLRGYNRSISPLTLCGNAKTAALEDSEKVSLSLETMMDVMERFNQEGEMFLKLRKEALHYKTSGDDSSDDSNSSSESSVSSDSSSDDEDMMDVDLGDNSEDPRFSSAVKDKLKVDAREKQKLESGLDDFAIPGVTTAMYDTILDAMACAASGTVSSPGSSYLNNLEPEDLYRVAGAAWKAHDLNNQHNSESDLFFAATTPTMVTYNATLRGIGNLCLAAAGSDNAERKTMMVDQGLAYGFGVYNHLTHNDHCLPKRNSASIIYLLQVIQACIPPSRTRGNMTVALWHQASMEGLVTPELISTMKDLHAETNGPEFDVFLESLDKCTTGTESGKITPQRFARFAKKFRHSKFY
jgi:hypothetical protein